MSFKEVTALRKSGRIDEALEMARNDYGYSRNQYSASALFWTLRSAFERELAASNQDEAALLYDEAKSVLEDVEDTENIAENALKKMEILIHPELKVVHDALDAAKAGDVDSAICSIMSCDLGSFPEREKECAGWTIFYFLRSKWQGLSLGEMGKVIDKYLSMGLEGRSRLHSMILFYAVRYSSVENVQEFQRLSWFRTFFEKWGMADALAPEDWEQTLNEGKKLPSLAEKAIKCYSSAVANLPVEEIPEGYKRLLETAAEKVEENENILRKLALLEHKSGNDNQAISITKNLIRTHSAKFWTWYELAQYVGAGKLDLCLACCSKALLATKDEKFLGTIHLGMGSLLVRKGMYAEALCEAEKYKAICQDNGWRIKGGYSKLFSLIPSGTSAAKENRALYRRLEGAADEFVYSDLPGRIMVLTGTFTQELKANGKKRLMFVLYDRTYSKVIINPNSFALDKKTAVGSCFEVKSINEGNRCHVVCVKPVDRQDVLTYAQATVDNVNPAKNVIHVVGDGFNMVIPMKIAYKGVKVGDVVEVAYTMESNKGVAKRRVIDFRKKMPASH